VKIFRRAQGSSINAETAAERPAIPEETLVAVQNLPVGPDDLTLPPLIVTDPRAVAAVCEIAERDARSPGMDMHSRDPIPPSANFVAAVGRSKLDRVEERAQAVISAAESGFLGRRLAARPALPVSMGMLVYFGLVLLTAAVTEVIYGQTSAQILTGATPDVALLGALGFTLATNLLAWGSASAVHRGRPGLLHNHGVRIGAWTLLMIFGVAVVLGLVVGGYDPAQPIAGGISGGGVTEVVTGATTAHRPLLALAYFGLLTVIICSSFLAHLLHLDQVDRRRVEALKELERLAEAASLDDESRPRVAAEMLQAHLDAVDLVHAEGRRLVAEYNAAFARALNDPDISWRPAAYDDSRPVWTARIETYISATRGRTAPRATSPDGPTKPRSRLTVVA
jgi:hypothetical protein